MATYLASNNGSSTLVAAITTSTATSFVVATGEGARFPSPTGGDYTLVTLENGTTREIVCVVGRSSDTLTIGIPGSASANVAGRNYESISGMSATTFASGSVVSCRATAAVIAAGTNAGANTATTLHAATAKTPAVDADELALVDSAASWVLKKITLTTLWAWIQTHLASPGAIGATTPAAISGTTGTFTSTVSATQVTSTVATGTAPLVVASTTEVANLKSATATLATSSNRVDSGLVTIASASTTGDIFAAAANTIDWTGTATTTAFPAASKAGMSRTLVCAGASSFTAGANLLIDGVLSGSTLACAANDVVLVLAITTTQFKITRLTKPSIRSSNYFQSAQQTIAATGLLTIAHGLGLQPVLTHCVLVCTSTEYGYSAGDEVPFLGSDGDGGRFCMISTVSDTTNINVRFGTYLPFIAHKTTGAGSVVSIAKWKLVVRVWA